MSLLNALPQNTLHRRIEQEFSSEAAAQIFQYWKTHEFDDWQDMFDDINGSYDDCCCKDALFKHLHVSESDNTQKQQQYLRLKQCLPPSATTNAHAQTHPILQNIIQSFTTIFNENVAANILDLFNTVVRDEFDGIESESIQDDVADIDSSTIIEYVINQLNYTKFDTNKQTTQNIIGNGIKCVCTYQTKQFMRDYHRTQTDTPIKDTAEKPMPSTLSSLTIATPTPQTIRTASSHMSDVDEIVNQIKTHLGGTVAQLFGRCVEEQEFIDLDAIQLDMHDINDSLILDQIMDNVSPTSNLYETEVMQKKIRNIVMGNPVQTTQTPIPIHDATPTQKLIPHKPIPQDADDTKIEEIKTEIKRMFDAILAQLIVDKFTEVLEEQDFDLESLVDDVHDIKNSEVFDAFHEIDYKDDTNDANRVYQNVVDEIRDIVLRIGQGGLDFNIFGFQYHVTKEEVKRQSKFVTTHCRKVYQHLMGIAATLTSSDLSHSDDNRMAPKVEGKSLCIAKSVDAKNGKPIMYWLLMLFSKERSGNYRNEIITKEWKYNVVNWWEDNSYCQWIVSNFPNMAENMRAGLTDLVKRTLPPINYNHALFPIICDRLNDFARYALAFQQVAYRIQRQMKKNVFNAVPIQLDYWIIPRLTRARDMNQSIFFGQNDTYSEPKYLKVAEDGDYGGDIWDIEALLTHKKLGYRKDVDYFVDYVPHDFGVLHRSTLFGMIKRHHLLLSDDEQKKRMNRYIIIIDRRDRDNVANKELRNTNWNHGTRADRPDKIYMIGPKQYRNEQGKKPLCICGAELRKSHITTMSDQSAKCNWCDEVIQVSEQNQTGMMWCCPRTGIDEHKTCHDGETYRLCGDRCQEARPDTHGKISSQWKRLPESCLSLSKSYVLFNPHTELPVPITLDDALNGYMFGISYHILKEDTTNVYWYHMAGGTKFELRDMEKGWPQWFDKVDGQKQRIDSKILKEINDQSLYPPLRNHGFDQFEKQCREIGYHQTKQYRYHTKQYRVASPKSDGSSHSSGNDSDAKEEQSYSTDSDQFEKQCGDITDESNESHQTEVKPNQTKHHMKDCRDHFARTNNNTFTPKMDTAQNAPIPIKHTQKPIAATTHDEKNDTKLPTIPEIKTQSEEMFDKGFAQQVYDEQDCEEVKDVGLCADHILVDSQRDCNTDGVDSQQVNSQENEEKTRNDTQCELKELFESIASKPTVDCDTLLRRSNANALHIGSDVISDLMKPSGAQIESSTILTELSDILDEEVPRIGISEDADVSRLEHMLFNTDQLGGYQYGGTNESSTTSPKSNGSSGNDGDDEKEPSPNGSHHNNISGGGGDNGDKDRDNDKNKRNNHHHDDSKAKTKRKRKKKRRDDNDSKDDDDTEVDYQSIDPSQVIAHLSERKLIKALQSQNQHLIDLIQSNVNQRLIRYNEYLLGLVQRLSKDIAVERAKRKELEKEIKTAKVSTTKQKANESKKEIKTTSTTKPVKKNKQKKKKAKKTSKQHPQQNRKTKKKPKKRSTTASEYDPPNSCKKQNVMIPRTLTTEIIPQRIKEELNDVFDYMDKSLALQYTGDVNNGIVVLNYDMHDAKTAETLYCMMEAQDPNAKNARGYRWRMHNKLYTAEETRAMGYSLPPSPRLFMQRSNHEDQIIAMLSDVPRMQKMIQDTKWNKIDVFNKENGKSQKKMVLYIEPQHLIKILQDALKEKQNYELISILMFNDDNDHWIEFIQTVRIGTTTDVGISFKYDPKRKTVKPTGIHLDGNRIGKQHALVSPCDIRHHLQGFESDLTHMKIGDLNKDETQLKHYQNECAKYKSFFQIFVDTPITNAALKHNTQQLISQRAHFGICGRYTYQLPSFASFPTIIACKDDSIAYTPSFTSYDHSICGTMFTGSLSIPTHYSCNEPYGSSYSPYSLLSAPSASCLYYNNSYT
eukprot:731501_1